MRGREVGRTDEFNEDNLRRATEASHHVMCDKKMKVDGNGKQVMLSD